VAAVLLVAAANYGNADGQGRRRRRWRSSPPSSEKQAAATGGGGARGACRRHPRSRDLWQVVAMTAVFLVAATDHGSVDGRRRRRRWWRSSPPPRRYECWQGVAAALVALIVTTSRGATRDEGWPWRW